MRDVRSSSLNKNPDSCQALLNFIEWWLIMFCLNEVTQVAARSSAASNSVTFFSIDERCSFLIPPQKTPTAVKHFWILLIDDWSCFVWMSFFKLQPGKQFGDLFFDRREVFVLHPSTKFLDSCQALLYLLSDDWWCLIWWGHTSCNQVFSCKQFGDIDWLNACQAAKVIHKCYA